VSRSQGIGSRPGNPSFALGIAILAALLVSTESVRAADHTTQAPQAVGDSLPKDVDPDTRSRLPRPRPDELDDLGKQLFADIREGGDSAPRTIRVYSSKVAQYMTTGNQYLRYESGIAPQLRELAILLAARAMDQQYEWTAHEEAARAAGLPQSVIDIVNHGRPATGIADQKQAVLIQLGREALYDHRVTSDTFARALPLFGKKALVDIVSLMGHYTATAVLLNVFDQHLRPGQTPLLAPAPARQAPR
jgi:4-carboxymuconolactone decarboxylase